MKNLLQNLLLTCTLIVMTFSFANAQSGLALSLNGVDGFMKVTDHNDIDIDTGESFSITLWFRTTATGDYYRIISKRDGAGYEMITQLGAGAYGMNLRSVNNTNSGPPFGSTSITDGIWHHLAMIVNTTNSTATIYVDANQEQQSTVGAIGTQSFANNVDLLVGTEISESIFTPGFLDNIRLWSTPLSQTEIEADMTTTVDGTENNLIAAYDFENVSGTAVPDLKGNHPGTLCGGAVVFDPNAPMQFSSATLVQRDIPVGIGEPDEGVMAVNVATIGNLDPVEMSSLTFNMNGTTDLADVANVKIYYTESSERFAATNLFGTTTVASGNITVTGNQLLGEGSNYFWVTYDLTDSDSEGHFIDSEIVSVMVAGNEEALANPSVNGARLIILEHKLLFSGGDFNSVNWRIPAITTAADGSLVVVADARRDQPGDLPNHIDPVSRRSIDNGETWSAPTVLADFGGTIGAGDVAMITDKNTSDIIAIFPSHEGFFQSTPSNRIRTQLVRSTDNGITWTAPIEITDMVNKPTWYGAFSSSGSMNQTRNGRIIHSMVVRPNSGNTINAFMIFSDDGGLTWDVMDNVVSPTGNESKVVELDNDNLMFNLRNSTGLRQIVVSEDGGQTWGSPYYQSEMPEPGVNGDFIRYTSELDEFDKSRLLFSVASWPDSRRNLTIFISYDEGETWSTSKVINPGPSGYSALTVLADGTIGCFYENGEHEAYQLYFARISLDWLSDGADTFTFPAATHEQLAEQFQFEIFPNPGKDYFDISFDLAKNKKVKANLLNASGDTITMLFHKELIAGKFSQRFKRGHLASGVYYLQFNIDGNIIVKKLVFID